MKINSINGFGMDSMWNRIIVFLSGFFIPCARTECKSDVFYYKFARFMTMATIIGLIQMNLALAEPLHKKVKSTPVILLETIDRYEPITGAYLGTETTHFSIDGKRLRWEIINAEGVTELLFFVKHDLQGRECEAIYFEEDAIAPSREVFTYSEDERIQTTTYFTAEGQPADRTEVERDVNGRALNKKFFNSKGQLYGKESVYWNPDGTMKGWDFSYTRREGGAVFRYDYFPAGMGKAWAHRIKRRDGKTEWIESRTIATMEDPSPYRISNVFARAIVSTDASETSPSFSTDGRTMVFARYDEDWTQKVPFIATLHADGWQVSPLDIEGGVYNLSIAPDAKTIVYSKANGEKRSLFMITRVRGESEVEEPQNAGLGGKWSKPMNLTKRYGLQGAYPCLTEAGDLLYFDSSGPEGSGIYLARSDGEDFTKPISIYTLDRGTTFDPWAYSASSSIFVTRCLDDICNPDEHNGVFQLQWERNHHQDVNDRGKSSDHPILHRIENLPYVWGVQPVPELGLLVFTDGEDILVVPLRFVVDGLLMPKNKT